VSVVPHTHTEGKADIILQWNDTCHFYICKFISFQLYELKLTSKNLKRRPKKGILSSYVTTSRSLPAGNSVPRGAKSCATVPALPVNKVANAVAVCHPQAAAAFRSRFSPTAHPVCGRHVAAHHRILTSRKGGRNRTWPHICTYIHVHTRFVSVRAHGTKRSTRWVKLSVVEPASCEFQLRRRAASCLFVAATCEYTIYFKTSRHICDLVVAQDVHTWDTNAAVHWGCTSTQGRHCDVADGQECVRVLGQVAALQQSRRLDARHRGAMAVPCGAFESRHQRSVAVFTKTLKRRRAFDHGAVGSRFGAPASPHSSLEFKDGLFVIHVALHLCIGSDVERPRHSPAQEVRKLHCSGVWRHLSYGNALRDVTPLDPLRGTLTLRTAKLFLRSCCWLSQSGNFASV
jgi:hypothetical protein